MDKHGVLRRSSSVTRRMIHRGVSIKGADEVLPYDQLHTSFDERKMEKQSSRRATMQLSEEAARKCAANTAFKYQAKLDKDKELNEANQRVAERERRYEELQRTVRALGDLVDVTENSTEISPSKTNTYIDQEGNLRRRITAPPNESLEAQDGFICGPVSPPPPAPTDEPREYC